MEDSGTNPMVTGVQGVLMPPDTCTQRDEGTQMDEPAAPTFRRRQYRRPPVVEAIARVHLSTPIPWSITTPGRLYSLLDRLYPREPDTQELVQAEISPIGAQTGVSVRSTSQRLVLRNEAADRLLIVSPNDVSVHGLVPYEGWESLIDRLREGLESMAGMTGDSQYSDLGVRYVNRISVPETTFDFTKYFTIGFTLPPGFPRGVTAFMDRVECNYPEGDSRIAFTWASTEAQPGHSGFLVDLDLTATRLPSHSIDDALQGLHRLKERETEAFESLIQDELRAVFDEVR